MAQLKNLISASDLAGLISEGEVQVFDCGFDLGDPAKGHQDYLTAHLPGARYLDLERDLSGPAGVNGRHPLPGPAALVETLRGLGLRRDAAVVAYDSSGGMYAARLWWMLRWLGHGEVAVLDGGLQAWKALHLPLDSGLPPAIAIGDFASAAGACKTVSASDVLANLGTSSCLVIDARASSRFVGQPHPMDPVAGHIPGARNRFFGDNLNPDGYFKPAAQLAQDFGQVLGTYAPADVILQCGSGVTACHNALAMEIASLPGARLYPGSWSEWISDPTRPVETGPETRPAQTTG